MFLVGDVGGTKTRLALFEQRGGVLARTVTERYDSRSGTSFEDILGRFLSTHSVTVTAGCFGVPGPVVDGVAKLTNLPWTVTSQGVKKAIGASQVALVNDLAATVASLPHLTPSQVETLHPGELERGELAVSAYDEAQLVFSIVAPGTGLGEAVLVKAPHGSKSPFIALPSEGGHSDYAPTNQEQIALLQFLMKRYPRVSLERLLCGPGLVNIYQFLRDDGRAEEPRELREQLAQGDHAAVIAEAALKGQFEIAVRALDIFCEILGVEAGNIMLKVLSYGGVYLGGGIPPKILPKLKDGAVLRGYLNKGRLTDSVRRAPLRVVTDDHAALIGAAHIAADL